MSSAEGAAEAATPAPVDIRFQPTRGEYLLGLLPWLPWPALWFVLVSLAYVRFVQEALQAPGLRSVARLTLFPIAAIALEVAYRATRGGVTVRLDAAGLAASWHGQDRRWPWSTIRVRETTDAFILRGSLSAAQVVPRRALDASARATLLAWLEARRVPRFRPGRILGPLVLGVLALLAFVTVYNLMQGSGSAYPRVTIVTAPRGEYDGAAALTMLLREGGHPVSLDELQAEVAPDGTANAQKMIEAAGRRGLVLRGFLVSDARDIASQRLPCIAHLREAAGLGQTRLPQANERGHPVSLDELQAEVAPDGTANAQKMVEAAGRRGLVLRGYLASDARDIASLTLPCIAHLREAAGLGQTRLPQANERGHFVVLERADAGGVTYVDPIAGRRIQATMARFLEHFSGVVLVPAEPR